MRRFLIGVLGLLAGYAVGVGIGIVLVSALSGNTHDKSQELAVTSALVTGPIGALIGLVVGVLSGGKSRKVG